MRIDHNVTIPDEEITLSAVRAQGAGGQNVNKVASAIHLRFDVSASSLPEAVKQRLLARGDQRITEDGVVVIKAQSHRTQERNRQDATGAPAQIGGGGHPRAAKRVPTKPTRAAKKRRLEAKKQRGRSEKTARQAGVSNADAKLH